MQKHLLTDGVKEIYLNYAEGWDELSRKDAIYAGNMLYLLTKKEIEVDQFRKLMVDRFIRRNNFGNDKLNNLEKSMDMWANEGQLADTVNFFFKITKDEKKGKEQYEILPTGIRNLVPRIRLGMGRYYGPGDFLEGMSFGQFKDALASSQKYMETLEDEWLTRLAAICYQKRGQKYSMETSEKRIKKFRRINTGIKMMCFCYVMGCMHNIRTDGSGAGIEIDGQLCRLSILFKGNGGGSAGVGMIGVLMSLAESGVFGNIKETSEASVWDVLTRLYQLELQRREMEKKK